MTSVLMSTEKGDWGRNNYILKELESDVVILGSSRAIHHYNPKVFSDSLGMSCYNCGEDGMGIFLMYARYMSIKNRCYPKLIIYEIMPEFDLLPEKDNLKYLKYLRPYIDNDDIAALVYNIRSVERYKLWSCMYQYNSVFLDIVSQNKSKAAGIAKEYTYSPLEGQMDYEPNVGKERKNVRFDSLKIDYLQKIIDECKKNSTQLIFSVSPMYKPSLDAAYVKLNEFCKSNNITLLNHYSDTLFCMKATLFRDAGHMNKYGAECFTAMLVSEIKSSLSK